MNPIHSTGAAAEGCCCPWEDGDGWMSDLASAQPLPPSHVVPRSWWRSCAPEGRGVAAIPLSPLCVCICLAFLLSLEHLCKESSSTQTVMLDLSSTSPKNNSWGLMGWRKLQKHGRIRPSDKGKLSKLKRKKTKEVITASCSSFSSSEKDPHKHFPSNLPDTKCSKLSAEVRNPKPGPWAFS